MLRTARILEQVFPLVVGWVNVEMAVTTSVRFSLPTTGTIGLYDRTERIPLTVLS